MKALLPLLLLAPLGLSQELGSLNAPPVKGRQYVVYAAEQQVVAAGRHATLDVRFHVVDGFHVNSHTPRSELQIPTAIELAPATGVKVGAAVYPAGKEYSFSFDPSEKLDVYSDDFTVKIPLTAAVGAHELKGKLRYQACDHAACYPPRELPLSVLFTAR